MRAGATLIAPTLGGIRLGGSCDASRDAWFKKYGNDRARTECARGFKGKRGCDKNFPSWCATWGHPWGAATPSATPVATTPFFGAGSAYNPVTPATPVPVTPSNPAPAPTPTPQPAPIPACTTDWTSATAEIRRIAEAVRSCQTPSAALPAEISPCAQGSGSGTGSYQDYLAARAEFQSAKDDAVLCSSGETQTSDPAPATNYPTSSGSTVITSPGTVEDEIPMVEPDTSPLMSKGTKIGVGVGGVVLLGVAVLLLSRRGKKRSRRA